MSESKIDSLSLKNYENNPRKEIRYVGELVAVRRLDPEDFEDASRYRSIQGILPDDFTDTDSTDFVLDWEKLQRIMHQNADITLKTEIPLR